MKHRETSFPELTLSFRALIPMADNNAARSSPTSPPAIFNHFQNGYVTQDALPLPISWFDK